MDKNNKLGNKGFMLLETLIVSTIILSTLVFLYIQFTNIKKSYDISFRYNTVSGLYSAKELGDFLIDNGTTTLSTTLQNNVNFYVNITNNTYVPGNKDLYDKLIIDMNIGVAVYVDDDLTEFKKYLNSDKVEASTFNEEFKKYIMNLQTNATEKDRIIIKFKDNTYASILLGGK